jgi:tetratricopeptide (TPR) repeat protein
MNVKPVYFYIALFFVVVIFLYITVNDTKNNHGKVDTTASRNNEMPQDEIHQNVDPLGEAPSKNNVSGDILRHMNFLKKQYQENPNDTAKIKEYADFLYLAHQTDKALPLYEKLIKLKPKDIDARFTLTYIYYQNKELDKAEKETDMILSYDNNNPQALYNKGAIVAGKGKRDEARKIWNEVIKKFPNSEAAGLSKSALEKL